MAAKSMTVWLSLSTVFTSALDSLDVSDVSCELGDEVQVMYGVRGITSGGRGQGICEWLETVALWLPTWLLRHSRIDQWCCL